MEEQKERKCYRCNKYLPIEHFESFKYDDYTKSCIRCRTVKKIWREKNKDKIKQQNSKYKKTFYKNNKKKVDDQNKEYRDAGRDRCEHNLKRAYCKLCGDPIKVTIQQWLSSSKTPDIKHNRYDPENFIDKEFLYDLIDQSNNECVYCKVELQFVENNNTLASIERIDNTIGHTKNNCVIACLWCNNTRGYRYTHNEFHEYIQTL